MCWSYLSLQQYQKMTKARVFFCEFCEAFNIYFAEHLRTAASENL